jgi:hypothetical protein
MITYKIKKVKNIAIFYLLFPSINSSISFLKFSLLKANHLSLIFPLSNFIFSNLFIASFKLSLVCSLKNIQVSFSITVSNAQPLPYAITGVQQAIASIGTIQKSSSGGNKNAFAFEKREFVSSFVIFNFHSIFSFEISFSFL